MSSRCRTPDFKDYQKDFEDAIARNDGFIDLLWVTSGEIDSAKFYKLEFTPINESDDKYTVIIRKFHQKDPLLKSTTSIEVRVGDETHEWVNHERLPVDEVCAIWLIHFLFMENLGFSEARLMLPPKYRPYDLFRRGFCEAITTLVITVGHDERDAENVKWWLLKMGYYVQDYACEIKINSSKLRIDLKNIPFLQESKGVEISGNTNIDTEFIRNLRGKYFIYRNNDSNRFTEDQLKELCQYFVGTDELHAVFLEQGTEKQSSQFFEWLNVRFIVHQAENVEFYGLKSSNEHIFYFKTANSQVTLGNFESLERAREDHNEWRTSYADEI